jgi:hypothetical protein
MTERDPARRSQARPERRPQNPDPGGAPANRSASPVARGDGWHGPPAYRRGNGARQAPAADHQPFYDDSLEDVGR